MPQEKYSLFINTLIIATFWKLAAFSNKLPELLSFPKFCSIAFANFAKYLKLNISRKSLHILSQFMPLPQLS